MKKSVVDIVTEKINRGEVKMLSRFSIFINKFRLQSSVIILFLILTLALGFIFYWLSTNSDLLFGGYGRYGYVSFFRTFPYLFFLVFVSIFIVFVLALRSYDFSYKKPFIFILTLILMSIGLIAVFSLREPRAAGFYEQKGRFIKMGRRNNSNLVSGVVYKITISSIVLLDVNNQQVIVRIDRNTHFPFGKPRVGDFIRSVGVWRDGKFEAHGVRVFYEFPKQQTLRHGMRLGNN